MTDRGSGLLPSRLLRRSLIGAAAVALVGIVLWGLQKASAGISFDAMVAGIRATSPTALLGSLAATFLSFAALLGYDLSGLRYAGARTPFTAALLASFCGFAIGKHGRPGRLFRRGGALQAVFGGRAFPRSDRAHHYCLSRSPSGSDSQRSPRLVSSCERRR